ncbi:hypothetical protein [Klebsiella aerogenes EA1509E]|nr:hypothetical protein [Klebsiella aerogenes EA1509E]
MSNAVTSAIAERLNISTSLVKGAIVGSGKNGDYKYNDI